MDKNVSQLDPKLKEAYDRVMGTVVTPPAKTNEAMPAPSAPSAPAASPIPTPASTTPVIHAAEPIPAPAQAHAAPVSTSIHQVVSSPTSTPKAAVSTQKKSGSKAFIFLLGGIVFFVVYAIVWIKMFSLKVPLLNP